ncbi:MAG: acyl-CoA dehydrogenase family protein [Pseudomonadota bacterium]
MTETTNEGLDALRAEVREFLDRELTDELRAAAATGFGIPREAGAAWHRKLYERGWIAPDWPVEYGGTGWGVAQRHLFETELARAGAPMLMPFGLGMVGPVLCAFGTDEQQREHLPGILDGSVWWCQGYSEPGSGSDLASLKTAAVRDGDDYVVNGQKIWTTNAHKADWIFALVRTDPTSKPQRGISFLLIDMQTPGIEVRPIVSIDGLHHLNEVYFTEVRVPAANRIGDENLGWTYAKYLLGHERAGIAGVAGSQNATRALRGQIGGLSPGLGEDDAFAGRLAAGEVRLEALAAMEARVLAELSSGNSPGDAASALKILGTELQQNLQELGVESAGYYALPFEMGEIADPAGEGPGPAHTLRAISNYNFGRASSIYGGSNEIQRNVIAKAVLGL